MRFLRRIFEKKQAKRAIEELQAEMETKPAEAVFEIISPPMPGTAETIEDVSVTDQYVLVSKKLSYAVEENKDTRRAAKRLMDAIGVGPEPKKSSSQNE
jgi:hypothetical protein